MKRTYPVTVLAQLTYKESKLFPLLKNIPVRYLSSEFPVGHIAPVGQVVQVTQLIQLIPFSPVFPFGHIGQTLPVSHLGPVNQIIHWTHVVHCIHWTHVVHCIHWTPVLHCIPCAPVIPGGQTGHWIHDISKHSRCPHVRPTTCPVEQFNVAIAKPFIWIPVFAYRPRNVAQDVCVHEYALYRFTIPVKRTYPVTVLAQLTYKERILFPLLKNIPVRYLSCEFPVGHIAPVGPVAQVIQLIPFSPVFPFGHIGQTSPVSHLAHVTHCIHCVPVAHCIHWTHVFPMGHWVHDKRL